jgi:hypothetical protein
MEGSGVEQAHRHCERSEAIQNGSLDVHLDCFAALAMTDMLVRNEFQEHMS